MIRSRESFFVYCLAFVIFLFSFSSYANNPFQYSGSEHITMGDNIKLFFSAHEKGQTAYSLHLPNGLTATYGEIIALGDLYGFVGKAISLGNTKEERKARFVAAFNSFASNKQSISETRQLIAVLRDEQKKLLDGLNQGLPPEKILAQLSNEVERQENCITGGGCLASVWWIQPGRYLNLASDNYDHFGEYAWIAYQTGHEVAIETAKNASQSHDLLQLELAYAMNAFACHFLSDRFSSGHIRTPRMQLSPNTAPDRVGELLVNYMHNEENPAGLHVHNIRGDHWIAYGDRSYLNSDNNDNRLILNQALQISANEIFAVYLRINFTNDDNTYRFVPIADEVDSSDAHLDISPLFYWDIHTQKLMRRADVTNLYDRHWTADWWGWTTLLELAHNNGMPSAFQAALARSDLAQRALLDGLIIDKNIIAYLKSSRAGKK